MLLTKLPDDERGHEGDLKCDAQFTEFSSNFYRILTELRCYPPDDEEASSDRKFRFERIGQPLD